MALATLTIDIEARLARFESDLGKASRQIDKLANSSTSAFRGIGEVFAGSALSAGLQELVGGIARLVPELIDGVAKLQDLADETNASAEGLAEMRTAADVSGVSLEQLAGYMVKLTSNLSGLKSESKPVSAALKALGLDVQAFRQLRPDEQIRALADAFNKAGDSSTKTAAAVTLFGRGGAGVLRFFKEYTAEGERLVVLTGEQIRRADDFADAQARVKSELRQTLEAVSLSALPALIALGKATREFVRDLAGVQEEGDTLSRELVILDWAEGAAIALATVGEAAVGVAKTVAAIGGSFAAVAADIKFSAITAKTIATGAFVRKEGRDDLARAFEERNRTVAEASQRYVDLWTYDGTAASKAIRKAFAEQREALKNPPAPKPKDKRTPLNFDIPDEAEAERARREFAKLMEQIRERQVIAEEELNTGERLSAARQFERKILADLAAETSNLDEAQKAQVRTALAAAVAQMRASEMNAESVRLRQADARAVAQQLQQLQLQNATLAEQQAEIGLTSTELERLRIARLAEAVALEEERVSTLAMMGATEAELAQRRLIIEALREQLRLRKQSVQIDKDQAGNVSRGVDKALDQFLTSTERKAEAVTGAVSRVIGSFEDDLTSSLRQGEFSFRRLADVAIEELLRINVVKPALAWLLSAGGSGGASLVSTALSFLFSAKGNAFSGGKVVPFAAGGIFGPGGGIMKVPTLFRMRGGWGVGGEAGDEAVLPLARTATGQLGVRAAGGGGGANVQQVQQVYNEFHVGGGVSRAELLQVLQVFGQQIKGDILTSMRNGGVFANGS